MSADNNYLQVILGATVAALLDDGASPEDVRGWVDTAVRARDFVHSDAAGAVVHAAADVLSGLLRERMAEKGTP